MYNARTIQKMNEQELKLGLTGRASWHDRYKDSAYIFIGGIDYELTEGDILKVFSQYGEIVDLDFKRDEKTGKPLGFCFLAYEDQRSTILAVDNLNGIQLGDRMITVNHKEGYFKKVKKSESEESKENVSDDEGSKKKAKKT